METIRRFLVLTPAAFAITAAVLLPLMTAGNLSLATVGIALLTALAVTAGVLVLILAAAGLLRLLRVRNAWAVLGAACVLAVVTATVAYALVAASLPPDDEGWNLLYVTGSAVASVPAWLGYAVGLLVLGRRDRVVAARNEAG
ncbi:hypothetical protein [Promicromonospora sp. NPDC050880]|uniref:hypothetical protein n=1 Tax=unclassified Promicromonospora TaxID=2647929 RepID=UPI00379A97B0